MNPNVTIALPGMLPSFQNIQDNIGKSGADIYYQLKSFRCANRFINSKVTDKLYMGISLIWARYTTDTQFAGLAYRYATQPAVELSDFIEFNIGNPQSYVYYKESYKELDRQVLTAQQICDNLNTQIRKLLETYWSYTPTGDDTVGQARNYTNLVNLFTHSEFYYDASNGKIALSIYDTANFGLIKDYNFTEDVIGNNRAFILWFDIQLVTDISASQSDQVRIGKSLGMISCPPFDVKNTIIDPSQLKLPIDTRIVYYPQDVYVRFDKIIPGLTNGQFRQIQSEQELTMTVHFPYCPKSSPYDCIYIKTSLMSSIMLPNGQKSATMAIIPMTGSMMTNAVEYQPSSVADRIYNMKDSLSSLQSFSLSILDEIGQPVEFIEPYDLMLAVFFQPKEPLVDAF